MQPDRFFTLCDPAEMAEPPRFTVVAVPYDGTSTWRKGADRGPNAVLAASDQLELLDLETGLETARYGIDTSREPLDLSSPEQMVASVQRRILELMGSPSLPVVVGGEHSVSIGAVRAAARAHDELTVLQLDAHADLRDEYEASRFNHACVMARVAEVADFVQVGIRSADASELPRMPPDAVFYADRIRSDPHWVESVVEKLGPRVYITFDLDVFDPSILPATGTPEPGGLLWYETLSLLRAVITSRQIVGLDVVELCPLGHHASEYIAAKLIYKMMSYVVLADRKR